VRVRRPDRAGRTGRAGRAGADVRVDPAPAVRSRPGRRVPPLRDRVTPVVTLVLVSLALASLAPGTAFAQGRPVVVRYAAPVAGAVLQGFDPPDTTFGAGHRGVDLAAVAGDVVGAAADGRVVFAGSVAGDVWVSIAHADGVTTSYGPMADLRVRAGQDLARAETLGRLAAGGHGTGRRDAGLHWGARIGGRYIDPMDLLDGGVPRPSLIGVGGWRGTSHAVTPYEPWEGGRWWGLRTAGSPAADRPGFVHAPNPNHLVSLGGFGTDHHAEMLDATHLGYDLRSVTAFSYAGRHDDPGAPADPRRDQLAYTSADTWGDPRASAAVLAEQLRAQAIREPGRAVDLIGHSQGGLVAMWYLLEHHDPYDRTLPPIGNVITVASPLDGSDAATVANELAGAALLGPAVTFAQERGWLWGNRLRADAPAVGAMAVGSASLWDLAVAWEEALEAGTAGPLATGTRVLNLGGSRDTVVSSARTRQPDTFQHRGTPGDLGLALDADDLAGRRSGMGGPSGPTAEIDGEQVVDHRVLPGGHASMLTTEAIREVTWRFLAGEEVVDSPGRLSRVVGGEIAETVGIGAELYNLIGPLKLFRNPDRIVPLGPAETGPAERGSGEWGPGE
jgi:hypothetical protein